MITQNPVHTNKMVLHLAMNMIITVCLGSYLLM